MVKVVKRSVLAGVMVLGMSGMMTAMDAGKGALQVVKDVVTSDTVKDVVTFAALSYVADTGKTVLENVIANKSLKGSLNGTVLPVATSVDRVDVVNGEKTTKQFKGASVRVGAVSVGVRKDGGMLSVRPTLTLPTFASSSAALAAMTYGPDCIKKRS